VTRTLSCLLALCVLCGLAWVQTFAVASVALRDRQALLDAAADQVERELTLIGATAIEDRLQAGVPATLAALRRAGVRVWVLTGDKRETAVSVACAAGLIRPTDTTVMLALPATAPTTPPSPTTTSTTSAAAAGEAEGEEDGAAQAVPSLRRQISQYGEQTERERERL
jgi:magnesium-transporting ATPase (P-type)